MARTKKLATFEIDPDLWQAFKTKVTESGSNISSELLNFVKQYVHGNLDKSLDRNIDSTFLDNYLDEYLDKKIIFNLETYLDLNLYDVVHSYLDRFLDDFLVKHLEPNLEVTLEDAEPNQDKDSQPHLDEHLEPNLEPTLKDAEPNQDNDSQPNLDEHLETNLEPTLDNHLDEPEEPLNLDTTSVDEENSEAPYLDPKAYIICRLENNQVVEIWGKNQAWVNAEIALHPKVTVTRKYGTEATVKTQIGKLHKKFPDADLKWNTIGKVIEIINQQE